MAKVVSSRKASSQARVAPIISYQPAGVRQRGRGVAYEWSLPTVLKFVEKGIEFKRVKQTPPTGSYIVAYDGVRLRTLEMVRRWLLKAKQAKEQIIEVPSRGTPNERYDLGGHLTIAGWFGRFIHDELYQDIYCPWCRKSYSKSKLKFVILGPCPSGEQGHGRAPTGDACPKGHLLIRH